MTTPPDSRMDCRLAPPLAAADLKSRLQDVIGDAPDDLVAPLVDSLADLGFDIETPPAPGLLMMNVKEPDGPVFHLGEVLVTQAQVRRGDQFGFGCCMGDRPEAALALACLDAISRLEPAPGPVAKIQRQIDRIHDAVSALRESEARKAALTRVEFHSMAEE